jgi:hypothetical protein
VSSACLRCCLRLVALYNSSRCRLCRLLVRDVVGVCVVCVCVVCLSAVPSASVWPPSVSDMPGSTAISMASEKGHLEVVHALINHKGVDVNVRDNYGYTALDLARMNSKGRVARLLEEYMEHENLLVENNPAGSGSKLRVTRYPPRRNVNGASSDNAKIEQVKSKCAEPVEYSLEYISQYLTSEKREKRIAEEHAMEVKRRRQEWLNRSAGSGAVQQLTADPRRQTKIPSKR